MIRVDSLYVAILCFLCAIELVKARNVVTRHIYEINADVHDVQLFYGDVLRSDDDPEPFQDGDVNSDLYSEDQLVTSNQFSTDYQNGQDYDLPEWQQGRLRAIVKQRGNNRWKNNEVPYEISGSYSSSERQSIESAISALQGMTCFKFPKRNKRHKDYVYIDKKDGCYSFVGKRGGKQLVSLGVGCLSAGTVQHEMMHAMGIEHEHQRPDRDKYIRVKFENVDGNMKSNFDKIPYKSVDLHGLTYDYSSVMHYDGQAFGKTDSRTGRKMDTMVPIKSGITLRDNTALSQQDKKKLAILGECSGSKSQTKKKKKPKRKTKRGRRVKKRRKLVEPIYDY